MQQQQQKNMATNMPNPPKAPRETPTACPLVRVLDVWFEGTALVVAFSTKVADGELLVVAEVVIELMVEVDSVDVEKVESVVDFAVLVPDVTVVEVSLDVVELELVDMVMLASDAAVAVSNDVRTVWVADAAPD